MRVRAQCRHPWPKHQMTEVTFPQWSRRSNLKRPNLIGTVCQGVKQKQWHRWSNYSLGLFLVRPVVESIVCISLRLFIRLFFVCLFVKQRWWRVYSPLREKYWTCYDSRWDFKLLVIQFLVIKEMKLYFYSICGGVVHIYRTSSRTHCRLKLPGQMV